MFVLYIIYIYVYMCVLFMKAYFILKQGTVWLNGPPCINVFEIGGTAYKIYITLYFYVY